ncbi:MULTISPECIES: CamS family sex pheromone protein [Furfurilactobacillus]|uniref:Lipoprotein n=2 Tax=Furfurilactobacillus TaxID=2767882 RepID=A0A0R1RN10_9LACO|nr:MULTISPECIES: CamS family sex pheromone protein [Furfurilactobacillus]KRL56420.1 lipoprotein precursor [Furfurilactobacillus rossiae DSM 15814]MCF6160791.1 CamS family sex pheromone protein [Furfurilactobacillus milii]MCF6163015.1 CamS family sex pheromone protein [Furfurilactobacillus milii]MDF9913739.1 CamS family sex pheromone protein [Furfurilactobacillus milii]QFR67925.1 CamS family sex pheromone protein [Furfurilactobacillus rossiae]
MKKFRIVAALLSTMMLLAACGNLDSTSSSSTTPTTSKKKVQTTGQTNSNNYQGVIKNGHYLTSAARGVTNDQDNNTMNLKSFESGLLNVSKKEFKPSKYIFQEGQYLSTSTVQKWVERKSNDNPTGLNPVDNGQKDANKRNPLYLQTIEEQDYMTQDGDNLSLSGMTIGIGLNSVDYYTKEKYGAQYSTNISDEQMTTQGRAIAAEVLKRVRATKGVGKDVPIVIALYKQASDDSLVGGTFFSYSVNDGNNISSWQNINQRNVVFPSAGGSSTSGTSNDESNFENFKTQIQNFFPNLSGVTAQAQYQDDNLAGMNVTITTQFYSQTEIISFTQYLAQVAPKYLPSGVPIDITVQSTDGVQSFLSRDSGQTKFSTHVFGSY